MTVSPQGITAITGTITFDNGVTVQAPGTVTPVPPGTPPPPTGNTLIGTFDHDNALDFGMEVLSFTFHADGTGLAVQINSAEHGGHEFELPFTYTLTGNRLTIEVEDEEDLTEPLVATLAADRNSFTITLEDNDLAGGGEFLAGTYTRRVGGGEVSPPPVTRPDLVPENWATLDFEGWHEWMQGLDVEQLTQEQQEAILQWVEDNLDGMTEGGREFWYAMIDNRHFAEETFEAHRGTWTKGDLTLTIEARRFRVEGGSVGSHLAGWHEITQIRYWNDEWQYNFRPTNEDSDWAIEAKLEGGNLVLFDSGPDTWHGIWTRQAGGAGNTLTISNP